MSKSVWAPHSTSGNWTESTATGWDYCVPFHRLQNLIDEMNDRGLRGRVSRLAIAAHGTSGGAIPLTERTLRSDTAVHFESYFQRLRRYLTPNAMLIFNSCIAGYGESGTNLLLEVSKRLPGRMIVAYTAWLSRSISGMPFHPGTSCAQESPNGVCHPEATPVTPTNRLFAKWAYCDPTWREGLIVRWPATEIQPVRWPGDVIPAGAAVHGCHLHVESHGRPPEPHRNWA